MSLSTDGKIIAVTTFVTVALDSKFSEVVKGRGQVYTFDPITLTWKQLGADLEVVDGALAMSSDGTTVALSTNCTEPDGFLVYHCVSVRRLDPSSMQWRQVHSIRSGRPSIIEDRYGFSIHVSVDGTIIAVGATGQRYKVNFVELYKVKNDIYAPISAPIAAPFSIHPPMLAPAIAPGIPMAAPMNAPVVDPKCTASNYNIATYQLYDSGSELIVSELRNGTIVTNSPPANRTNIEAVIACNKFGAMNNSTRVEIQLFLASQMIHSRVENYFPYFLFGNNARKIYSGHMEPSTYRIRVIVNQTIVSPFITFILIG